MAEPKLPESAAETLRQKILTSKTALREIARQSGIAAGVLSRFSRGERDVRLSTAERIADALGVRLKVVLRKAKAPGKATGKASAKATGKRAGKGRKA